MIGDNRLALALHDGPGLPDPESGFRFLFRFFRCYFLKRGFLDGVAGLAIARSASFSTFVKYAKLWEARLERRARGEATGDPAT